MFQYDDSELLCGIPSKMVKEMIPELLQIIQERDMDLALVKQLENI